MKLCRSEACATISKLPTTAQESALPNPKSGLQAAKRATDMAARPEETWYVAPPGDIEDTVRLDLSVGSEGSWLVVRQRRVGHLIVDFAINQFHCPDGPYRPGCASYEVARVDCSHGSCHWHYMDKTGDWSRWGRPPIAGLYDSTTHHEIDALYWTSYDLVLERWEENLARWRST